VSRHASDDVQRYLRAVSFRLVVPHQRRARQRFALDRPDGRPARLLELFGSPFDALNTDIPDGLGQRLRPLLGVPRMSTLAIGGLVNRAVASMPPGHAFVNVGVWQGFTFLAGMAGNPDKPCIGVDNFSQLGGPREQFLKRFEGRRGPAHTFHEMDYRDYFARVHEGSIGVYLYDGEHSYENQMHGLEAAEPFLGEGSLLIVDDVNWEAPRQATLDFVAQRAGEYHVVADLWTAIAGHPTFWNGLLVIGKGAAEEPLAVPPPEARESSAPPPPGPDLRRPAVSLVVLDAEGDPARLSRAVDSVQAQTWPDIEVVVADGTDGSRPALADALARTSGDLVGFVDTSVELRPDAVELSVAYPSGTSFFRPAEAELVRRAHRGIAAAADVDQVVSPDDKYVLVADPLGLPATSVAWPGIRLDRGNARLGDLDDDAALQAIDRARADGATHLVVMWNRFDWLEGRPKLAAALAAEATTAIANDRVRVFKLGSAPPNGDSRSAAG
jgi:hypothetical protein